MARDGRFEAKVQGIQPPSPVVGDGPSDKALVLEASEIFPSRFMEIFDSEICLSFVQLLS